MAPGGAPTQCMAHSQIKQSTVALLHFDEMFYYNQLLFKEFFCNIEGIIFG